MLLEWCGCGCGAAGVYRGDVLPQPRRAARVLAILWALAAAVGYGRSDFAAGMAARRASGPRGALMPATRRRQSLGVGLPPPGPRAPRPPARVSRLRACP